MGQERGQVLDGLEVVFLSKVHVGVAVNIPDVLKRNCGIL